MKRIFGAKKEVKPPPTMDEAVDKLNTRGDTWVLPCLLPGGPHAARRIAIP